MQKSPLCGGGWLRVDSDPWHVFAAELLTFRAKSKTERSFCSNLVGKDEPFVCVPFAWLALPKSSRIFLHYLKKPKFCRGLQKTFEKDVKKHIKLFSAMYCAFPYLDRPFNYLFLRQKTLVKHYFDGWQILDSFEKTHKNVTG